MRTFVGITKYRSGLRVIVWLVLVAACLVSQARGEKRPMTAKEMTELATHIVVGKVTAIYSFETKDADWQTWNYVAEVAVNGVEKGTGVEPGQLVYVRYWQRAWINPKPQPPGTNGHTGLAAVGQTARYYLVNKGYDGAGENTDGGSTWYSAMAARCSIPTPPRQHPRVESKRQCAWARQLPASIRRCLTAVFDKAVCGYDCEDLRSVAQPG